MNTETSNSKNYAVATQEAVQPNFDGDFYEVLGVDWKATQAEILQAYRRLIRRLHPDHNEDTPENREALLRVQKAYDVLSNKNKREFYDLTRTIPYEDHEVDTNAEKVATSKLMEVIQNACSDANDADLDTLRFWNPVSQAERAIATELKNCQKAQREITKVLKRLQLLQGKFRKKNKNFNATPLGVLLGEQVSNVQGALGRAANDEKVLAKALKVVGKVQYEPDERPSVKPPTDTRWVRSNTAAKFYGLD